MSKWCGAKGTNGMNDINGCGLESCDKRYNVQNIDACKAKCAANIKCKSFSWAPQKGDKKIMGMTVCSLYDSDVPTQQWGPQQILCGLDQASLLTRSHQELQSNQKEQFKNMKEAQKKKV
eukprot:110676_1